MLKLYNYIELSESEKSKMITAAERRAKIEKLRRDREAKEKERQERQEKEA